MSAKPNSSTSQHGEFSSKVAPAVPISASSHVLKASDDEPKEFKVQILPAGSAPKDSTFQPNVGGELAPGQPNNSADTTYDDATLGSKTDVHKGLGSQAEGKNKKERDEDRTTEEGHHAEIKSATEREPETAANI